MPLLRCQLTARPLLLNLLAWVSVLAVQNVWLPRVTPGPMVADQSLQAMSTVMLILPAATVLLVLEPQARWLETTRIRSLALWRAGLAVGCLAIGFTIANVIAITVGVHRYWVFGCLFLLSASTAVLGLCIGDVHWGAIGASPIILTMSIPGLVPFEANIAYNEHRQLLLVPLALITSLAAAAMYARK